MTDEWHVKLPPGVRPPFEVYINGVRQELGADYRVAAGELVFTRELVRQKLGFWAWCNDGSSFEQDISAGKLLGRNREDKWIGFHVGCRRRVCRQRPPLRKKTPGKSRASRNW